jgi:phosphopantothenoylcysteine decarboxylase/phosphopantothenate--cysteine ligase
VKRRRDGTFVVGFKAETGDPVPEAQRMLREKGPDLVVANDTRVALGGETTEVALVSADGVERLPRMTKREVAERLVAIIAERLNR